MPKTLFHSNAMGPCGARGEGSIEVQLEVGIFQQRIVCDLQYPHFVIALSVNLARSVFIEEIVRNNETGIVSSERQVMRTGVLSETNNCTWNLVQMEAICRIQHSHLSGL